MNTYQRKIEELEAEIESRKNRAHALINLWSDTQNPPAHPGDTLIIPDTEYANIGKTAKVISAKIGRASWNPRNSQISPKDWCWRVETRILNKDGKPNNNARNHHVLELPLIPS